MKLFTKIKETISSRKEKLKARTVNKTYVFGGILIFATLFSNFLNFLYNAYLGRSLRLEDFALISLIGSILMLSDIPVNAIGRSVTFRSAHFLGKYKKPAFTFWKRVRKKGLLVSMYLSIIWLIASFWMARFFQLESAFPIVVFTPIWLFGLLLSIDSGYLRGSLRFGYLAFASIIEAIIKLFVAIVFVEVGFASHAYLAVPISFGVTSGLVAFYALRLRHAIPQKSKEVKVKFPYQYFWSNAVTKISSTVYLTFDVILAKHFLPPAQAGQYALLALTGKMVYFAGSLFAQFIVPVVSRDEGAGVNSKKTFNKLIAATSLSCFGAFVVIGLLGNIIIPMAFGEKANSILQFIVYYTLGMAAFTIASSIVSFHQIKGRQLLPSLSFLIAIIQVVAIFFYHESVGDISNVMATLGIVSLVIALIVHIFYSTIHTVVINIQDFLDVFRLPNPPVGDSAYKILIFNWRDTRHMWAGGAEVYIHEIAKRFVSNGNYVMVFCGNDRKSPRNQVIDGVHIIRRGGFYTVYIWAAVYYLLKFRNRFDIVIDSENGIPFFAPLYSLKPVILLIHHVHQEVFINHLKFPFSYIARFIEGTLMPLVYRNCQVITVSESSKNEILNYGLAKEEKIQIVHPGVNVEQFVQMKKTEYPSFVYLGRVKAYKNIQIAIKAFSGIVKNYPDALFSIIGEGEELGNLKRLVSQLKLEGSIEFHGKVTEEEKAEFLATHWCAIQPSQVEGWGITVIEANASGTPVIASRVNGLIDSIADRKTGILVPVGNIGAFQDAMEDVITDARLRKELSQNALVWSKKFSWDEDTKKVTRIITEAIKAKRSVTAIPAFGTLSERSK